MNGTKLPAARFPWYGWLGLAILGAAEVALLLGVRFAATWFTPIMWTGYILFADALSARLCGRSWISGGLRELPLLALLSVAVWLLFEVYNLKMRNWAYLGVPSNPLVRDVGYFWSFATIMPGVFLTADLVGTALQHWLGSTGGHPRSHDFGPQWAWFLLGTALVAIPVLVPADTGRYLFGAVWVGFILLLDPINERLGLTSLRKEFSHTSYRPALVYAIAGLVCGLIWEAWNYQAFLSGGAYWVYTFPQALRVTGLHYGQMPISGLLGFPPFALELRACYVLLRELLGGNRIYGESPLSP
jgi:hypothetical protein